MRYNVIWGWVYFEYSHPPLPPLFFFLFPFPFFLKSILVPECISVLSRHEDHSCINLWDRSGSDFRFQISGSGFNVQPRVSMFGLGFQCSTSGFNVQPWVSISMFGLGFQCPTSGFNVRARVSIVG